MDIQQQIEQDFKNALKTHNELELAVLRSLKSALTYASVDEKAKGKTGDLTDQQIQSVFAKESKKRQDSADVFTKGGAEDRAEQELAEKKLIEKYLPEPLSEKELGELVENAIFDTRADGVQAMGAVIGAVRNKAGSRVDGAKLAEIVKKKLSK